MKVKKLLLLVIAVCCSCLVQAQDKKATSASTANVYMYPDSKTIFSVGNDSVSVGEFKYIYEKNNAADKGLYTEKNLRDYLDLYIKFKLKVKAAYDEGLDTSKKFVDEFNGYRQQLAQPYLTDREVTGQLIDESYERMKTELRASHILIGVSPDASSKDTLKAYNRAMRLRQQILKGADFEKLARDSSDDPSVANNGGDLGYFSAFQMIYPFESGAYALKNLGDISMPIRTRFGYHIIKLTDRRPYRGEIQVRHIMINSAPSDPLEKQKLAKNKIDSLYSLLQKGVPFANLARQYSDHVQSRAAGGELGWFNSFASYPEEFKNQAFALKNNGDYSKPFRTSFGWHIVQRIGYKPLQSRKEMEDYLKNRIAKDTRSEKSREAALARFKKELNFKESKKADKKFAHAADTSLLHGNWKANKKVKAKKVMFKLGDKEYTQADFAKYIETNEQPDRFSDISQAVRTYLTHYEDQEILSAEDRSLEKKYPEFRNVAKEYKEGILLFEITTEKVWNKATTDTAGRNRYFEQNRNKYWWKERADAIIVDLRDKAAVPDVMKKLEAMDKPQAGTAQAEKATTAKGAKASSKKTKTAAKTTVESKPLTIDSIANGYVRKDPLSFNYKRVFVERGENKVLDTLKWKEGVYDAGLINGRYYVIKINKVYPPAQKKMDEVKGQVIADYQDALEKQWIQELRNKYPVKVNEPVVQQLIKK